MLGTQRMSHNTGGRLVSGEMKSRQHHQAQPRQTHVCSEGSCRKDPSTFVVKSSQHKVNNTQHLYERRKHGPLTRQCGQQSSILREPLPLQGLHPPKRCSTCRMLAEEMLRTPSRAGGIARDARVMEPSPLGFGSPLFVWDSVSASSHPSARADCFVRVRAVVARGAIATRHRFPKS